MIATSTFINLLAQAGAAPSAGDQLVSMVTPLIMIFVVFYFLMWRPQSKRQQEHESFLNALKSGDEIVTSGGVIGTVRAVDGKVVTVEVAKGTKIRVLKAQIRGSRAKFVDGGEEKKNEKEEKKEKSSD